MPDDFENNINHRMQGFRINPDPQIWERVAAALPPEKRRRRFAIWWWLLPVAACLGGGIWLAIDGQKIITAGNTKVAQKGSTNQDSNKPSSAVIPAVTTVEDTLQKQANKPENLISKQSTNKKEPAELEESKMITSDFGTQKNYWPESQIKMVKKENEIMDNDSALLYLHVKSANPQIAGTNDTLQNPTGDVVLQKLTITEALFFKIQQVLPKIDSINVPAQELAAAKDTASIKKTDSTVTANVDRKNVNKKTKINKVEWSLSFAAGKSNLKGSSINNRSERLTDFNNGLSGVVGNPGQAANTALFSNPQAGFSFNTGVARRQVISKHWGWQAEMNYQLLTSRQTTGNRNDSLSMQKDAGINAAYYRGTATNYTNRVHRLQTAIGINFTLNPSAGSPVQLFTGLSQAYNFSNNVLLHDYRSGSHIRSAKLSNKWMFGSTLGLDVFINKKVHAGIFYQYDFTNVARPKPGSSFHWNQLQVRLGIPLSKHK